jgi:HrpA-like RNA helicase
MTSPHTINASDIRRAQEAEKNFINDVPFSAAYKNILHNVRQKKLPVYDKMQEFLDVFQKNQVMVLVGPTGSGKTTQIPQFVGFSFGWKHLLHNDLKIGVTEPRQIAANATGRRIAQEMDVTAGLQVGYKYQGVNMWNERSTRLLVLTSGTFSCAILILIAYLVIEYNIATWVPSSSRLVRDGATVLDGTVWPLSCWRFNLRLLADRCAQDHSLLPPNEISPSPNMRV